MTTLARTPAISALTSLILQTSLTAFALTGQESLPAARELYTSARYEEALEILDRLRAGARPGDEAPAIERYRAFCLLALGRAADAERAIQAVVEVEPFYLPPSEEVSPRLRAAFRDVRRRTLPAIVQQRYGAAKAAYDQKAWAEAVAGFTLVLELLGDPDIAAEASHPPLRDVKTLASGFHDLSAAAAAPPQPPLPARSPPEAPLDPAPFAPPAPRIYTAGVPGVVPPVAIRQSLPPFPTASGLPGPLHGVVEVVIDERGAVESAEMRVPLAPVYDRQVIAAARAWQYKPATLDGVPVKFRKVVQVTVRR